MSGLLICYKGTEDVARQEIEELISSKADISETALIFEIKDKKELARLCYRSQSAIKVLYFLGKTKVEKDFESACNSIKRSVDGIDFSGWLDGRTFKVRCRRIGEHDYTGQDICVKAGKQIIDRTKAKVSMLDPGIIIYIYIHWSDCYIGIDFSGFDLSKRDYRVFTHPDSLNASIAYSLVRIGDISKGTLIDPFSGSGIIPIEGALYVKGISPHHFKKDKFAFHTFLDIDLDDFDDQKAKDVKIIASDHILKYVKSIKNNAKLAGVDRLINVTRMDIEWLDTKLDKCSVDLIVSHPPFVSRIHDKKYIGKLYKEFFYQADYILKKKGKIILCIKREEILKESLGNFQVSEEFRIWQGKQELKCLVFKRAKST